MYSPHVLQHILPALQHLGAEGAAGGRSRRVSILDVAAQVRGAHFLPALRAPGHPVRLRVHLLHVTAQVRLASVALLALVAGGRFRTEVLHGDVLLEAPLGPKDLPTVGTEVGLAACRKLVTRSGGAQPHPPGLRDPANLQSAEVFVAEGVGIGCL